MPDPDDVTRLFLLGARAVATALADPAVAAAWDQPSVLEEQSVGSLAGHLARGGVWVVGDYLDGGVPEAPVTFESAGEYYATLVGLATPAAEQAIRQRAAAVAAGGPAEVLSTLAARLDEVSSRLESLDAAQLIAVVGGSVMRLADYLTTRIVEQTVHLDDLARSLDRPPWPLPPENEALTIAVGAQVGHRLSGAPAMMRALYRQGFTDGVLPVM
jgi:Mycothiol maleylpyruvate isomerase N-terminal domain